VKKDIVYRRPGIGYRKNLCNSQSGSGKSYLIAVLCEQLLQNNIAFCIVDTEGEYFSLKENFKCSGLAGKKLMLISKLISMTFITKSNKKQRFPDSGLYQMPWIKERLFLILQVNYMK